MEPNNTPFDVLSQSLPSTTIAFEPQLLLHPPGADEFNITAIDNLPKNALGLQNYSDFVKAACQSEAAADTANQSDEDRSKTISIRGHSFRFVGVPICDSECSYQSDVSSSSDQSVHESHGREEAQAIAPVPSWTPTASPAKSILRRPSQAPLPPLQSSSKPLVYDYASSASPASRRMSSVSLRASSKRASTQGRRLSFDMGVQVQEPIETTEAEYKEASVSARKIRSRRNSMSSRRTSSASTCRPATYAGFEPSGFTDAGALLCEINGRKFLLVVDDVEPEEQVGTQCQPLDIEVEMDLLFEKMEEAGEEEDESVKDVEQLRSTAVLSGSLQCEQHDLGSLKIDVEDTQAHATPHSIPLMSLSDFPSSPGPLFNKNASQNNTQSETHDTRSQILTETGSCPIQPPDPISKGSPSKSTGRNSLATVNEATFVGVRNEDARSTSSPTPTSSRDGQNETLSDASAECETNHSHATPPVRKEVPRASAGHEETIASPIKELAEAAVITSIDLEEEEEVVATTAHATRGRSSQAHPPAAGPISESPSSSPKEGLPNAFDHRDQVSVPEIAGNVIVEVLHDFEDPEFDVPSSTPNDPLQPQQKTDSIGVCDNLSTQAEPKTDTSLESAPSQGPDDVLDQETVEVANSVAVPPASPLGDKCDSSTQATVPSSVADNVEFATQACAAVSIAPASSIVKNDDESRNMKSSLIAAAVVPGAEGSLRTHNGNKKVGSGIRVCTNISLVNIEPRVTAYQLAVLQTLTPNTKTALAKIRGIKGPCAVEGVQVSPVNSDAMLRQRRRIVTENNEDVQKHERGTSIPRSVGQIISNKEESQPQLQQSIEPSKATDNTTSMANEHHLRHRGSAAETSYGSVQVPGDHCPPGIPNAELRQRKETDIMILASPNPRQPEVLLRASIDPAPGSPIEFKQSKLGGVQGLFDDVSQLQDTSLLNPGVEFAGLMSPAPLARQIVDEKEIVNNDAEESEGGLQVVAVQKRTTRPASECHTRKSVSSNAGKPTKDNLSVGLNEQPRHDRTEMTGDSVAVEIPPTIESSDNQDAELIAVCEQPPNIDECDGFEDFEDFADHADVDFDEEQNDVLEHEEEHIERRSIVSPAQVCEERSKQPSVSSSRKRSAPSDVLSSETMDAPLKRTDCKEDDSQLHAPHSPPHSPEKPYSDTVSPVIHRKPKRASKRKKISERKQNAKNKKKRQWRELAHLPVDEVRIDEVSGPRRSKRQRFPRLKYWKNEVVSYERRTSQIMPTVSEVLVDVGDTDSEETWMPRW